MLSGKAVCVHTERVVCVFLLVSSQLPYQQGPRLLCALRGRLLDSDLIKIQGKRFPALCEVRLQTAEGTKRSVSRLGNPGKGKYSRAHEEKILDESPLRDHSSLISATSIINHMRAHMLALQSRTVTTYLSLGEEGN